MRPATRFRVFVLVLFVASLALTARAAQPTGYAGFYVFGDSLVDTGNIFRLTGFLGQDPAPPPSVSPYRTYYNGRFSNGPVVVDYLWEAVSGAASDTRDGLQAFLNPRPPGTSRAINFAFGGTGTDYLDQTPGGLTAPGFKGQVELFRATVRGRSQVARSLFVVATGSNDYRIDDFNVPMPPADVVENILDGLGTLYGLGARHFVVLGLPDPGFLPGGGGTPTGLADLHNGLLVAGIAALESANPGLQIAFVDLNAVLPALAGLGFQMTTPALDVLFPAGSGQPGLPMSLCLFVLPAACRDANFDVVGQLGQPYLFWDVSHPTTDAHALLSQVLLNLVSP